MSSVLIRVERTIWEGSDPYANIDRIGVARIIDNDLTDTVWQYWIFDKGAEDLLRLGSGHTREKHEACSHIERSLGWSQKGWRLE